MKKILLISCLLVVNNCNLFGQGLLSYVKWEADGQETEKFDRIAIDVTWNRWMKSPPGIKQGDFSFGFGAYWFKDMPIGVKSNAAFAIGFGFESLNFHHNGTFSSLSSSNQFNALVPHSNDSIILTNKLAVNYVDIPIEFRIRTINKTLEDRMKFNFKLYVGFKAGVLVNDHSKYKNENIKYKVYNLKNVLPYRYGPYLRLGFNKISFVGFYSMTSIFNENGESLIPFHVGISWMRF